MDYGGVRREWFDLMSVQLFGGENGRLFHKFKDTAQGLVHPNPHRASDVKLKEYEFCGKFIGKALYESALGGTYRQMIRAQFTRPFLAQIIGLRVNYKVS